VPAAKEPGLALSVRVDGVLALELVTVSQEPFATEVEIVAGAVAVTLMDCEAGVAPPRT
jgi:hypothetical protein